jgi:hypothetical protein
VDGRVADVADAALDPLRELRRGRRVLAEYLRVGAVRFIDTLAGEP